MQKLVRKWIEISGYDVGEEVILYGMDILLGEIIYTVFIITMGLVIKREMEAILFLAISVVGTGTMGGYHCNTRKCCFILTISTWLISNFCIDYLYGRCTFLIVEMMNLLFLILVYKFAPVLHKNKKATPTIVRRNKKRARIYDSLLSVLITILWFIFRRMAYVIWVYRAGIVISMVTAKYRQGGESE